MKKIYTDEQIDLATKSYLEAALWLSPEDDQGNNPCDHISISEIPEDIFLQARKEVFTFLTLALDSDIDQLTLSQVGHDLFLTRNGHGSGFWDREDLDEQSAFNLSELAHNFKEATIFNDLGELYYESSDITDLYNQATSLKEALILKNSTAKSIDTKNKLKGI